MSNARRRRRWPWVVLAVVVVVLATCGGAVVLLWGGRGADEASVDEAVLRFRDNRDTGASGFLAPEPGVYTYRGGGTERLSVLDASQQWGPRLPVTVTATDLGCWTFRVEYSTNHVQETFYCARDRLLEETGGRTKQRFDFGAFAIDEVQDFACRPPGQTIRVAARQGDSWQQSCTGHSVERGTTVTVAGTNTFLGRERVRVGGSSVEADHYRVDRTLTGDQTGTERAEFWYAARSGLPLRIRRDVRVESPSPLGAVVYTESGTLTIGSVTPRR
ncbi:MAG: hypothetical protein ACXW2Y_03510 [Acidimicrobiia bacterium]